MPIRLSTRKLDSLKSAPPGKRYQIMDEIVPGFGIRVTDTGQRTFILRMRFPGSVNLNRRALGDYPDTSLETARAKAAKWRSLVREGKEPGSDERPASTFAAVAEAWFAEKVRAERKAKDVEREVRKEFVARWAHRPITSITAADAVEVIREKKRTAPAQARNMLAHIKRLMSWAGDMQIYGYSVSPIAHIKPGSIVGEKPSGTRILSDRELAALWRVAGDLGYPWGSVYRILILTGLRLNEVADARWSEIDGDVWIIPALRMKAKTHRARPHSVPLTAPMLDILNSLPRFRGGGLRLFNRVRRQAGMDG